VDTGNFKETAMSSIQMYRDTFQTTVCMALAAVIVSASLAIGALGFHSLEQRAMTSVAALA